MARHDRPVGPLEDRSDGRGSLARRGSLDDCLKGHLRRILPSPCCPVSGLSGPSEPRSVPSNVIDQAPKLQTRSYFGWNKTAAALEMGGGSTFQNPPGPLQRCPLPMWFGAKCQFIDAQ